MIKRATPVQSWYLDLKLLDGYYRGHKYHHTVPISMLYALHEGLALVEEEGLEKRWERHRRNHLALVSALEKMGLGNARCRGKPAVDAQHRASWPGWTMPDGAQPTAR
jgi:aspartate aminotransferase-like enzyme